MFDTIRKILIPSQNRDDSDDSDQEETVQRKNNDTQIESTNNNQNGGKQESDATLIEESRKEPEAESEVTRHDIAAANIDNQPHFFEHDETESQTGNITLY